MSDEDAEQFTQHLGRINKFYTDFTSTPLEDKLNFIYTSMLLEAAIRMEGPGASSFTQVWFMPA